MPKKVKKREAQKQAIRERDFVLEGNFRYYFANPRVRVQDVPEGSFVRSTLVGPESDMQEAEEKYLIAYPPEGYDTRAIYRGKIVNVDKGKTEVVVVFKRFRTCD